MWDFYGNLASPLSVLLSLGINHLCLRKRLREASTKERKERDSPNEGINLQNQRDSFDKNFLFQFWVEFAPFAHEPRKAFSQKRVTKKLSCGGGAKRKRRQKNLFSGQQSGHQWRNMSFREQQQNTNKLSLANFLWENKSTFLEYLRGQFCAHDQIYSNPTPAIFSYSRPRDMYMGVAVSIPPPSQISRPRGSKLRNSLTILKIKIRELTYISLSHKQVKNRPPPPLLSCNESLPLLLIFLKQKRRENSNSNNYGSEHARKGATPKKEKRRKRRGNNFLSPSFLSL